MLFRKRYRNYSAKPMTLWINDIKLCRRAVSARFVPKVQQFLKWLRHLSRRDAPPTPNYPQAE